MGAPSHLHKVFYYSKVMTSLELFIEFFYEILNEQHEPLIALVELVKSFIRLREYVGLVREESLSTYIPLESYKDFKNEQKIRETHALLARSKKRIPKILGF